MPVTHYQYPSMGFVICGMDLLPPAHGTTAIPSPGRLLSERSNEFVTLTLPYVTESIQRDRYSKFCNDDTALNQVSSYPLCNTHNHISTFTRLDRALPSPEVTARTTEDITHTPAISPVLLHTSESSLQAFVSQPPSPSLRLPPPGRQMSL